MVSGPAMARRASVRICGIVEFVRAALGYKVGGYWELKKILKLYVAGAVEESGC